MNKILKDLYSGNISPAEMKFIRGSEYDKLNKTISADEEKLLQLLGVEGKEILKNLMLNQMNLSSVTAEENFIIGFRLGARTVIEVFMDNDGNFKPFYP